MSVRHWRCIGMGDCRRPCQERRCVGIRIERLNGGVFGRREIPRTLRVMDSSSSKHEDQKDCGSHHECGACEQGSATRDHERDRVSSAARSGLEAVANPTDDSSLHHDGEELATPTRAGAADAAAPDHVRLSLSRDVGGFAADCRRADDCAAADLSGVPTVGVHRCGCAALCAGVVAEQSRPVYEGVAFLAGVRNERRDERPSESQTDQ